MLLTFAESWERRLTLPPAVIDPDDDPELRSWSVWIPITWEGTERTDSVEDADDWKDDIIIAASWKEANEIALSTFGADSKVVVETTPWA
jgi:hypothetical protein